MITIMTEKTVHLPAGRILLKNVRVAFAHGLFEASTVGSDPNSKPRFGCSFLLPPDHPQMEEIRAKMKAVAEEKWKNKAAEKLAFLEKKDKTALHDGNDKSGYDGYAGNFYLSVAAQASNPPSLVNQDRTPYVEGKGMKKIYSGCFVNASVELWAQANTFGERINCTVRGVQFLRDGDSFSAASAASSDEFESVADGSDASEFA